LSIPVWHDDQQGTATVALAGLLAALEVVGKAPEKVRIVLFGVGAANVATYRLLVTYGVDPQMIIACDSAGILHPRRVDIEAKQHEFADKWGICCKSNGEGREGGPEAAFRGADVCLAFSTPGPDVIRPEWLTTMAKDAILFACANPVPEIWPDVARKAGVRVMATGRSDFPNQVNNSLVFPGIFRGVLDVRAHTISDRMAIAAANELLAEARDHGLRADHLQPTMADWKVAARIAVATGAAAVDEGLARHPLSRAAIEALALAKIAAARSTAHQFIQEAKEE
jgi:malate dehydrogenase (oxaloacetate-decarboxylating)